MRNLEHFQHLFDQTDAANQSEKIAKQAYKSARGSAELTRQTSDDSIFHDLASRGTLSVYGESILDYAEASMKITGQKKRKINRKMDALAKIILPGEANEPTPYYIEGPPWSTDETIGVSSSEGSSFNYELTTDEYYKNYRNLIIHGKVISNQPIYMRGSSSDLHWQLCSQSPKIKMNFANLTVIDDPEERIEYRDYRDSTRLIIGKEAVLGALPYIAHISRSPEIRAVQAYIQENCGDNIDIKIDERSIDKQPPKDWVMHRLTECVESLLTDKRSERSVNSMFREGKLPIIATELILDAYDLGPDEVKKCVLDGIMRSEQLLSEHQIWSIHSQHIHTPIAEILDSALTNKVALLNAELEMSKQKNILVHSQEDIVTTAIQNPDIYKRAAFFNTPRILSEGDHLKITKSIDAHFNRANRYRPFRKRTT